MPKTPCRTDAFRVSQSERLRPLAVFHLADAYRINAALERRSAKLAPRFARRTHHEDELPAAESFADDGPQPSRFMPDGNSRIIMKISTNSRPCCGRVLFREVEVIPPEKRQKLGVTGNR